MPKAERVAFVCPRFAEGGTVGGAETLLRRLAERLVRAGRTVTFLTTCARDHFTWENVLPPGPHKAGDLDVIRFPVDANRDLDVFITVQNAISRGRHVPVEDELAWIRNSVNSQALCDHLQAHGADYDRIVMGPYLFGLVYFASQIHPDKTFLVPCLHDEPFAYLSIMREMFGKVAGCLFNAEPERDLACRLFDLDARKHTVCGMGLEPFAPDPRAFAARHELREPYVFYSGRRESAKGIPLLTHYMQAFRKRTKKDVRLAFAGSGPIEAPDALRPYIRDFGFLSEEEMHEAMAGARAFIHPSTLESLGIVLLESFMAGTPALVHARSPVLRWQCERSGAGLWFRNYPEFEEELLLLLNDDALRAKMGASGQQFVRREYAWEAVDRRLFAALDR